MEHMNTQDHFENTLNNIALCELEMASWGLEDEGYKFKMIHPDSEFYYTNGLYDTTRMFIALPQHLMIDPNPEGILELLRHQIVHVLIDMDTHSHGAVWKAMHEEMGGSGNPELEDGSNSKFKKHFEYSCDNGCYPSLETHTYHEEYEGQCCNVCGEEVTIRMINIDN